MQKQLINVDKDEEDEDSFIATLDPELTLLKDGKLSQTELIDEDLLFEE